MHRWVKLGLIGVGVLVATGAIAFATFPMVRVLVWEGFPSETWPAKGTFQTVRGVPNPAMPDAVRDIPAAAQVRLAARGGRAILMDQAGQVGAAFGAETSPSDKLNSFSLVKSLVAVMVLKAVAEGKVSSLDDPANQYLGTGAPNVTLRELLTMTSGLLSDGTVVKTLSDAETKPFGATTRLHTYGMAMTMDGLSIDPDRRGDFLYQNVNTAVLGAVLEQVYEQPLQTLLSEQIWQPSGAADATWRAYPKDGVVSAYCCLYATPLDWLRVGRFLMENGETSAPFLPSQMHKDWLLPDLDPAVRRQGTYGLHIRHDVLDRPGQFAQGEFAYMLGHLGQVVYLIPAMDTVVVRFGREPQLLHSTVYELFDEAG